VLRFRSHERVWVEVAEQAWSDAQHRDVWIPSIDALDSPLVEELTERASPGSAVIEVLGPDEVDAAMHVEVQLARAMGLGVPPAGATDTDEAAERALSVRARAIARAAAAQKRLVVLVLPPSWPRGNAWSEALTFEADAGANVRWRRLRALLEGLHAEHLRAVVISGSEAVHPWRARAARCRYRRQTVRPEDMEVPAGDALEPAVREVRDLLAVASRAPSPAEARAMVGLAALEVPIDDLADDPTRAIQRFAHSLRQRHDLADALRLLSLTRVGLTPAQLVSAVPDPPHALRAAVVGYRLVHLSSAVRRALRDLVGRDPGADESAHQRLAAMYRARDGAISPAALDHAATVAWLEKVHHLANGGDATEEEWRLQEPCDREYYWARARYLSRHAKRYRDSADLYRECLERFGDDSYTHHYFAFNLDRARGPLEDVRRHYERAVELDPRNPWWSSRWVTFLIGHGTLRDSKTAFDAALEQLDPEGERLAASPWLALHLHRWVIRRWLALGYVAEARHVLDLIPREWRHQEHELHVVEQLVLDAEESLELGESVYPPGLPMAERWGGPRVTPATNGHGAVRTRWWPGRVVAARADRVDVVAAEPQTRMAYRLSYNGQAWRAMADQAPEIAAGYFELAEYADASRLVRAVVGPRPSSLANEEHDIRERLEAPPGE
jgi:tetratricopeptide (TPR) repeat protein